MKNEKTVPMTDDHWTPEQIEVLEQEQQLAEMAAADAAIEQAEEETRRRRADEIRRYHARTDWDVDQEGGFPWEYTPAEYYTLREEADAS